TRYIPTFGWVRDACEPRSRICTNRIRRVSNGLGRFLLSSNVFEHATGGNRAKHASLPQHPRPAPNSRGDVTVENRPTVLMPEAIVQRRDVFRQRFDIVDCGQVPAGLVVFD